MELTGQPKFGTLELSIAALWNFQKRGFALYFKQLNFHNDAAVGSLEVRWRYRQLFTSFVLNKKISTSSSNY